MKKGAPIKKDGRGGKRAGSGRQSQSTVPGEKKEPISGVRVYPSQKKALISKFGSLQKAFDSLEWE